MSLSDGALCVWFQCSDSITPRLSIHLYINRQAEYNKYRLLTVLGFILVEIFNRNCWSL